MKQLVLVVPRLVNTKARESGVNHVAAGGG
jgi:hypothetical protein